MINPYKNRIAENNCSFFTLNTHVHRDFHKPKHCIMSPAQLDLLEKIQLAIPTVLTKSSWIISKVIHTTLSMV